MGYGWGVNLDWSNVSELKGDQHRRRWEREMRFELILDRLPAVSVLVKPRQSRCLSSF
jgi:hypothetical protein